MGLKSTQLVPYHISGFVFLLGFSFISVITRSKVTLSHINSLNSAKQENVHTVTVNQQSFWWAGLLDESTNEETTPINDLELEGLKNSNGSGTAIEEPRTDNSPIRIADLTSLDVKMTRVLNKLFPKRLRKTAIALAKEGDRSFYYQKRATSLRKVGLTVKKKVFPSLAYMHKDMKNHFEQYKSTYAVYLCIGRGDCWDWELSKRFEEADGYFRTDKIIGFPEIWANKQGFCTTLRDSLSHNSTARSEVMKSISFTCWIMPQDLPALNENSGIDKSNDTKWIIKPAGESGGHGIVVKKGISELKDFVLRKRRDRFVVQPFMHNPLLINGRKFDLRVHVLVTSVSPMRVYVHSMGIVRQAYSTYDQNATRGGKRSQFLTNLSVNKKLAETDDLTWTFQEFGDFLNANLSTHFQATDTSEIFFARVDDAIAKVLVASEAKFEKLYAEKNGANFSCSKCFQPLGVDILVDDDMNPHVMEINTNPTMNFKAEKIDISCSRFQNDIGELLFSIGPQMESLRQKLTVIEERRSSAGDKLATPGFDWLSEKELHYLLSLEAEQKQMGGFRLAYPPTSAAVAPQKQREWSNYFKHIQSHSGRLRFHSLLVELQALRVENCKQKGLECSQGISTIRKT